MTIDVSKIMAQLEQKARYIYNDPERDIAVREVSSVNNGQTACSNLSLRFFTDKFDLDFLACAYKHILHREPDVQGKEAFLTQLRSGKKSKIDILCILRWSAEGKKVRTKIPGLWLHNLKRVLFSIPIMGRILETLFHLCSIGKLLRKINEIESFAYLLNQNTEQKVANRLNELSHELHHNQFAVKRAEQVTNDVRQNLALREKTLNDVTHKINQIDNDINELINNRNELNHQLQKLALDQKNASQHLKQVDSNHQALVDSLAPKKIEGLDDIYHSFTEQFRGSRELIIKRLSPYKYLIDKTLSDFDVPQISIDLGCGRGEWLEFTQLNGLSTCGVDMNQAMVDSLKAKHYQTEHSDVLDYLKSLPDESCHLITGFHIIEHLDYKSLIELYQQVFRVLKVGGRVLFETPNPENFIVGSCNFYIDPTHINPIPPVTTEFLLTQVGFKQVDILRLNSGNEINCPDSISTFFNAPQDYAAVGTK